jgi:hypothetical protein
MGYLGMTVAWSEARDGDSFRLRFENGRIFMETPLCTGKPIAAGQWYTFKDGSANFDICSSCYSCLVATFGLGIYSKEINDPAGTERI